MKLRKQKSGWRISGEEVSGRRRLRAGKLQKRLSDTVTMPSEIEGQGPRRKLSSAEVLVHEGQSESNDFMVDSGALMLFKSLPAGRRQVVGFRFPGDLVALRRCDRPWPVTVQALTSATLEPIDSHAFRRFAEGNAELGGALLDYASDEVVSAQEQVLTLGCKNTEERLATFLLEMRTRIKRDRIHKNAIHLPMSRCVIGDYLGLAHETVSRAFGRLADERLIALPRPSRVVILDRLALEALAQGKGLPSRKAPPREDT